MATVWLMCACVYLEGVCERDMGGMLLGTLEACEGTASPSFLNPTGSRLMGEVLPLLTHPSHTLFGF